MSKNIIEAAEQHEEYNKQATYEQALRALVRVRRENSEMGCCEGTGEMLFMVSLMFGVKQSKVWCDMLRIEHGEE